MKRRFTGGGEEPAKFGRLTGKRCIAQIAESRFHLGAHETRDGDASIGTQCWPSAARALAKQAEKRGSSKRARPDDVHRVGGKRGSSQLPELRKQKGRHSRRPKRDHFID